MKKSVLTTVVTIILSMALSALVSLLTIRFISPERLQALSSGDSSSETVSASRPVEYRTVNLSSSEYPDFTLAAENCVDAVVYVKVSMQTRQQMSYNDPFLDFLFGGQGTPQIMEAQASGSWGPHSHLHLPGERKLPPAPWPPCRPPTITNPLGTESHLVKRSQQRAPGVYSSPASTP